MVVPYVEIGKIDGAPRLPPRMVECGEVLPDLSGEPSERSLDGGSKSPVALAFEDPTAATAFWPSVPIISRFGRSVDELVLDMTDSVGLPGLSKADGKVRFAGCEDEDGTGDATFRCSRAAEVRLREDPEALRVTSLRRRSSCGVLP